MAVTRRAAVAAVPLGLLAACGGATTTTQSDKPIQLSKATTITAWLPATDTYTEYLNSQVTLFQQSQDKVKVTVEPSGATDKLQASIVAGDPPNLQQSN